MFDEVLDAIGGTPARVVGLGLALGLGVVLGRGLRPVAKQAVRGYMKVSDRVREVTAEASESLQDIYAEAKAERDQEGATAEGGA
jgi:hypothetical protein